MNHRSFARAFPEVLLLSLLTAGGRGQNTFPPSGAATPAGSPATAANRTGESSGASASPLRVVCSGDQLTIAAHDVPLTSILAEVGRCTGAKIDMPEGASDTRFFDTIGPGPVREVLATLLSSTNFNFVIGLSASDPDKIESVELLVQSKTETGKSNPTDNRPITPLRRAFEEMRQNRAASLQPGSSEAPGGNEPDVAANASQTLPAAPAQESAASQPAPPASSEAAAAASQSNPRTPAPDPVEHQINSMEQLFRQRSEMNRSQNPQPPPASAPNAQ